MKYNLIRNNDCDCDDQQRNAALLDRIYESQLGQKQILLNQPIDETIIEKAVIQIFNINDIDDQAEMTQVGFEREPIWIYINTPGGYMDEAFSLISAIEASRTPIFTCVLGKAYSAGFLILLAGHRRFSQKYSTIMLHQGQSGIMGEFNKIAEYSKYFDICHKKMKEFVCTKCSITPKRFETLYKEKQDWYMSADEALKLNVIDEIIN
jgi:ATP-dependent Clp protease protease subunit